MKFYVINGTKKTLVAPGGDWKIKPTREDNSIGFRFKFSGSIVLTDKDFDVIRAVELTDKFKKLYIEIWREVDGFYRKFWYGYFTPFTCQWNLQNSRVEFTPVVIDDYTNLIEGFEIEKNILEVEPANSFAGFVIGDTEILKFTEDIDVSSPPTGNYAVSFNAPNVAYIDAYNGSIITNRVHSWNGVFWEPYANNVYVTTQISNAPAFLHKPNYAITMAQVGDVVGIDILNAGFLLYRMDYLPLGGSIYRVTMYLIRQIKITKDVNGSATEPTSGTWINVGTTTIAGLEAHKYVRTISEFITILNEDQKFSLREYPDGSFIHTRTASSGSEFDSGRWLTDVIQTYLTDFGLTLKSDFLQSDINPVTGESENPTKLLQILQKSDAKYPSATEPATIGMLKFSDLITDLCVLFNLRWWVDGSYFRIEHISTLPATNDVDGTAYNGNYNARAYTYDPENIPKKLTLSFMDETDDIDFMGLPIEFEAENTSGRVKDNTSDLRASYISTDLAQMVLNPSDVSNSGFALVSVENNNGIYSVRDEVGILTGLNKANGYLSASHLISNFYNHDMPLPSAIVNGEQKTFASAQKRRKQEGITFPYTEISGFSQVKTELGWGEIEDAELDLKTMLYTTTIKT